MFCSSHDLADYVKYHFYEHLCAATPVYYYLQNISDEHPALEILHDLETTAYRVDESLSDASASRLARCIIQDILRWTNILDCHLKVGVPYVLCFFSETTS